MAETVLILQVKDRDRNIFRKWSVVSPNASREGLVINGKDKVRLPEPKTDYDVSNQKQINRAISLVVEQLNSTFLDEQKQEQERFSWFIGG